MSKDVIGQILETRAYTYGLLRTVLGEAPTKELLETLASPQTAEAVSLLASFNDAALDAAASSFLNCAAATSFETAQSDYIRNFIGPAHLPAGPWEGLYVGNDHRLFSSRVLSIRERYRDAGYLPALMGKVSDDHIGIELSFMEQLAQEAADLHSLKKSSEAREALLHAQRFLDEHLTAWVPRWAERMAEANGSECLYAAAAELASAFVVLDAQLAPELASEITASE